MKDWPARSQYRLTRPWSGQARMFPLIQSIQQTEIGRINLRSNERNGWFGWARGCNDGWRQRQMAIRPRLIRPLS